MGEGWAQYKNHPSMVCTVQDDDFTGAYRERCARHDDAWANEDELRSSDG